MSQNCTRTVPFVSTLLVIVAGPLGGNWCCRRLTSGILVIFTFACTASLWAKKPPKPPPEPPPVQYEVSLLGSLCGHSQANDINNEGVVVGRSNVGGIYHYKNDRAFRLIPEVDDPDEDGVYWKDDNDDGVNDLMENINLLAESWVEWPWSDGFPPTDNWVARSATSINGQGQIVGNAILLDDIVERAFLFDPLDQNVYLLPLPEAIDPLLPWYHAYVINDNGDVAGVYDTLDNPLGIFIFTRNDAMLDWSLPFHAVWDWQSLDMNNDGVLVASSDAGYRLQPVDGVYPSAPEYFDELFPEAINDFGTIAGWVPAGRKNDPYGRRRVFRLSADDDPQNPPYISDVSRSTRVRALDINNLGDVIGWFDMIPHLYTDNDGLMVIHDLVVAGAKAGDFDYFNDNGLGISAINDPDGATGYGQIVGDSGGEACVLTPLAP